MDNPRLSIPEGTVGIGGAQTGIYPFDRSGGWRLIGRTPLRMFDLQRDPAVLVDIGDQVQFFRIDREQYDHTLEKCRASVTNPSQLMSNPESEEVSRNFSLFVQPGLMTTVQDRGRFSYQWMGMPISGALDQSAYRIGNILLRQDENAACLEMTFCGPQLKILEIPRLS